MLAGQPKPVLRPKGGRLVPEEEEALVTTVAFGQRSGPRMPVS